MTSKRKLEEEIAREKDPIVRKQLQELLEKRETQRTERIDTVKKGINETIKGTIEVIKEVASDEDTPIRSFIESALQTFYWVLVLGIAIVVLMFILIR